MKDLALRRKRGEERKRQRKMENKSGKGLEVISRRTGERKRKRDGK